MHLAGLIKNTFMLALGIGTLCTNSAWADPQMLEIPDAADGTNARIAPYSEDMFVEVRVPTHQIYFGEFLRVEYDVYVAAKRGEQLYDFVEPDFMSWYTIEGKTPPTMNITRNERIYVREPFAVYYATPSKIGKNLLPALKVQVPYEKDVWITHEPVYIEVLPLPAGPPAGFLPGNIGQFKLDAEISSQEVNTGDVITVTVNIKGASSVAGMDLAPHVQKNQDAFREYPAVQDSFSESIVDDQIISHRTYRFRFLALKPGDWTIDAFELVTFNPIQYKYEILKTDSFTVHVTGDEIKNEHAKEAMSKILLEEQKLEKIALESAPKDFKFSFHILWGGPLILAGTILALLFRKRKQQTADNKKKIEHFTKMMEKMTSAESSDLQLQIIRELFKEYIDIDTSKGEETVKQLLTKKFAKENADFVYNFYIEIKNASFSTHQPAEAEKVQKVIEILKNFPIRGGH